MVNSSRFSIVCLLGQGSQLLPPEFEPLRTEIFTIPPEAFRRDKAFKCHIQLKWEVFSLNIFQNRHFSIMTNVRLYRFIIRFTFGRLS